MKVDYCITIKCGDREWYLYKRSSIPFLPHVGLKMYMDDCEHEITTVFWSDNDQSLSVGFDSFKFDTEAEALREHALWIDDNWFED